MKIAKLTPEQMPQAMSLLQKNNLPTEDLNEETRLFGTYEDEELVGIAGVELYGEDALIRSVCVDEAYRSKGMAELLTEHIEQYAKRKGAGMLYLLTTTAENYFKRKGFVKVNRQDVPEAVQQSSEFSSVCPSTAAVLKKELV
ncbi:MAG: arsenic resistance N-acetyltransferase ArsN2 [Chitinophagaceae bacterium]